MCPRPAALRLWPAAQRLRLAAAVSVAAPAEARTASEAATAGVRACEAAEHSPGGYERRTLGARRLFHGRLA